MNRGPVRRIFYRSMLHDIETDHAEFTAGRGVVITADAVLVLLDYGMAPSHPLLIAFDELGFLLSATGTQHGPNVRITCLAPYRAAGKGIVSPNAASALNCPCIGGTERAWHHEQRKCCERRSG
jgi:hypothetical protein